MAHTGSTNLTITKNDGSTESRAAVSDLDMMELLCGSNALQGDEASVALTTLDDGGVSRTITFSRANGQSESSAWTEP